MKSRSLLLGICLTLLQIGLDVNAQTTFDAGDYKSFLQENKGFSTEQLLRKFPPLTEYYSALQKPTSLKFVAWFDSINSKLKLTNYEVDLLEKQHFVVSERLRTYDWAYAFINIYYNDLPLFLSTDFVLNTLHKSYDAILMDLEANVLEANLKELLSAMYENYQNIFDRYGNNKGMASSLYDVDLYVSVALSLLEDKTILPQKADREMYDKVMTAIESEQMSYLNLFTEERSRKLDFSQFKPRGHYTTLIYSNGESRTLENYFRAMMWLGRIDFLMTAPPENPWEEDWTADELKRMQIGALLLNELLDNSGKRDLFEAHEKIIRFLVGPDDNLTPDELKALSGEMISSPEEVLNDESFNQLTDALDASDDYGQKIMSNFFFVDPDSDDPGKLPVSFRLLGQKFLLDSYITSEVVYDRIQWENTKPHRGLPDPLDVLGVLGNEDALQLMEGEMEKYHYAYKVNALSELISHYDDDFWDQSLYNTWLSAITTLNPPETNDQLPFFMKTTAWHHEKLNTQLASWAELRHDNILYGKQSYTGGTGCSFPFTYVEPYPELYHRISDFAVNAMEFFNDELGDNNKYSKFFLRYAEIMRKFQQIAEDELNGDKLNDTQVAFLKTMINSYMASGPGIDGWYNDLFFNDYDGLTSDLVVADIHTQPTDATGNVVGYVYHAGNGPIDKGVFLAPNPMNSKQLMAFTGPVSSFYYEVTSNFYRYNDQEWTEKFWQQKDLPKRPDWVGNYLAKDDGTAYPAGRELEGSVYVETNMPEEAINELDYLIVFPNPVNDVLHLRFVLNEVSTVNVEVIDLTGRNLLQTNGTIYQPGEHDIPLDISLLSAGNYIVQFNHNGKTTAKKILVN